MTSPARRTIFLNGTVLAMDGKAAAQQACVIEGSRIVAIGDEETMHSAAGTDAEIVDLDGATLMPGLIDSHPHAMHFTGFEVGFVDLLDARDFDDVIARIRAAAARTPEGQWIVTTPIGEPHYFVARNWSHLAEGAFPDRHVLDQASQAHPIHIAAWAPKTPNVCGFNTLGLRRMGLTRHFPEKVAGVEIERDEHGELTGILKGKVNNYYSDDPFWLFLNQKLPVPPDAFWELAGWAGMRKWNRMGVTAMYEAHAMAPPHVQAYLNLRAKGLSTVRVQQSLELSGYAFSPLDYSEEEVWALMALAEQLTNKTDEMCRVNGVTFVRGGPPWQGFLRMNDPYRGPDGLMTTGRTFFGRAVEQRVAKHCLDNNVRLNMVLGGYRDADDFLQTVDELAGAYDIRARKWVLQHCSFTKPEHVERYAAYDFDATMSCSFVYGEGDMLRERFGTDVLKDLVPLKRFWDAGMNLSCGTDWGPSDVFRQMALNETREFAGSGYRNQFDDHILTREQSLLSFTRNGARTMQWDGIGSLLPDYRADMVILDRNPMEGAPERLAETQVLRTILDGEAVYDSGAINGGAIRALPPLP